ncbi:MAG: spore cortex biosynthesis protein YabQ [Clostridia bacterium]|nr:spore cortex biosynthesis protein YabQ [Clostridia bacterium]
MAISQTALGLLYLYSAILGFCAGFFYDLFRVTRIFFGAHYSRSAAEKLQKIRLPLLKPYREREESRAFGVVVFLQDFFFCIICGIALAILFYECNDGVIRLPVIFVFVAGFLFYRATVCRLFMALSEFAAFLLESAARYLWYFLSYPFRMLGKAIGRAGRIVISNFQSRARDLLRARFYKREKYRLNNGMGLFGESPAPLKKERRKINGIRKKETIQPFSCNPDLSCGFGGAVGRDLRHKHHEIQPAKRGAGRA